MIFAYFLYKISNNTWGRKSQAKYNFEHKKNNFSSWLFRVHVSTNTYVHIVHILYKCKQHMKKESNFKR
jgi:hypothetical protein